MMGEKVSRAAEHEKSQISRNIRNAVAFFVMNVQKAVLINKDPQESFRTRNVKKVKMLFNSEHCG